MKYFLSFLFLFLLCVPLHAQTPPAFDNRSDGTGFDVPDFGWDLVVGGGCANPFVHVTILHWHSGNTSISSVTIGGSAATPIASIDEGSHQISTFRRVGVSTGTNAIDVQFSGDNANAVGAARSYCNVDQSTPHGTAQTNTDFGSTASVSVPSASGELVIDSAMIVSLPIDATAGSGQTERTNRTDLTGALFRLVESDKAGETTTNMSWTLNDERVWTAIALALKPVGAPRRIQRRTHH